MSSATSPILAAMRMSVQDSSFSGGTDETEQVHGDGSLGEATTKLSNMNLQPSSPFGLPGVAQPFGSDFGCSSKMWAVKWSGSGDRPRRWKLFPIIIVSRQQVRSGGVVVFRQRRSGGGLQSISVWQQFGGRAVGGGAGGEVAVVPPAVAWQC